MNKHLGEEQVVACQQAIHEEAQLQEMSRLFKILGDTTRLKIITLLTRNEELCVEDIIRCMQMEQSAISHQLRKLKSHHIVKSRKQGKHVLYSLEDQHVLSLYQLAYEHAAESVQE